MNDSKSCHSGPNYRRSSWKQAERKLKPGCPSALLSRQLAIAATYSRRFPLGKSVARENEKKSHGDRSAGYGACMVDLKYAVFPRDCWTNTAVCGLTLRALRSTAHIIRMEPPNRLAQHVCGTLDTWYVLPMAFLLPDA